MRSTRVWYLSKYALNKDQGGPTRQYYFCKYFSLKGIETSLISSNSNGFSHYDFNEAFQTVNKDGFDHIILKGNSINLGFNWDRIKSWILFEFRLLKYLKDKNLGNNDTVIVSSLSILTFLTGIYLKRKHKTNLIVEVRDIYPLTLMEFKGMNAYNPFIIVLSLIEKLAYKKANWIVGSMGNLGQHIKKVDNSSASKFIYIPMGYDKLNSEKNTKKGNKDQFIIGYAGTLGQANNVELILKSAKLLQEESNIFFKILGDGVLKNDLIGKYGNLRNVEFLPKVKKNEVADFLSTCDILVNPWEDHEIYDYGVSPNKWIDYMNAAKPIIVPYNGFQNIINEADCGEFIETNNPILFAETLVKYSKFSAIELKAIGFKGKEYLKNNLSYDSLSEKYIELFN